MDQSIQDLFDKYLQNGCSDAEFRQLLAYFKQAENELILNQLILAEMDRRNEQELEIPDLDAKLDNIHHHILQHIKAPRPVLRLWRIAAAAVVLLIAGTTLFLTYRNNQSQGLVTGSANLIKPGKYSATLTLAGGKKIVLNQAAFGQVAIQSGIKVSKAKDGRIVYQVFEQNTEGPVGYNTLSTADGELYTVVLPDGTEVTLNAASSLTYPTGFKGLAERKVNLTGEGYFVVKHDASQPFIVVANSQEVEDIGTEFNISSYTDDGDILTTLVSGSAKVSAASHAPVILSPALQASLTTQGLKVSQVNPALFTSWRNGLFAYQHTPLQAVMRQVARWYDIKVVYESEGVKYKKLSGSVSRYDDVTGLLNAIGYTAKVKFKIEKKLIIISDAE